MIAVEDDPDHDNLGVPTGWSVYGTCHHILLSKPRPVAENGVLVDEAGQCGLKHGPILLFETESSEELRLATANPMPGRQEVVSNLRLVDDELVSARNPHAAILRPSV